MNYTKNHHLPQWDETDRIMRTDFNQMCADMEAGLDKAAADTAAAAAKAASDTAKAVSDTAKVATSAAKAQTTADKAVQDAAAAQATANAAYCATNQPYVIGTYTGINAVQTVELGFQPKFIIITCADSMDASLYTVAAGGGIDSVRLVFTSSGFTVNPPYIANYAVQTPNINYRDKKYIYIAFR